MRWIVGKHSLPDDMNQSCAEGQNQVTTFRMILYCLQHGFKKGWKLDIRFESWTGYAFQTFLYYLLTDEDDF